MVYEEGRLRRKRKKYDDYSASGKPDGKPSKPMFIVSTSYKLLANILPCSFDGERHFFVFIHVHISMRQKDTVKRKRYTNTEKEKKRKEMVIYIDIYIYILISV